MRRLRAHVLSIALCAAALASTWPLLARAQDQTTDPVEEVGFDTAEEEEDAVSEWSKRVGNRYLVGVNSLVTAPADPVMSTVDPPAEFSKLPAGVATKYPAGFFAGTMLSAYRFGMGALDVLFAPLTPMKMLSPEPRYMIFPDVTHEEY